MHPKRCIYLWIYIVKLLNHYLRKKVLKIKLFSNLAIKIEIGKENSFHTKSVAK